MATLYAAKVVDTPKAKKPRTEKQIAAFEKAKETRKRKREAETLARESEIKDKEKELDEVNKKLEEAQEKKRIANEKRKQARLAKKEEVVAVVEEKEPEPVKLKPIAVAPAPEPVPVPVPVANNDTPPAWLTKFIQNVKQHENGVGTVKKPQKVIRQEAQDMADERWAQPKVREQVNKNVDNHMDRLYNQIFCVR